MSQPQASANSNHELQEIFRDRLELDNLHTLNVVTAIGKDMKDERAALLRAESLTPSLCTAGESDTMSDEDTVNWKTQQHFYPPQQAPAPQSSGLSKIAGPLLIAGSLLGTGGIGAAAYVGSKLIDKISQTTQQIEPIDNQLSIKFIGGADPAVEQK